LRDLLDFKTMDDLAAAYRAWIEESLREASHFRDEKWTESVAVGGEAFVIATKEKLWIKARGRELIGVDGSYELKESSAPYSGVLGHGNAALKAQNEYLREGIG
jgi:putative transposase